MNIFNKVLVVALLVGAIVFWAAVIAVFLFSPEEVVQAVKAVSTFMGQKMSIYVQMMVSLAGGIFIIISLLLLLVEFTPTRRTTVLLKQVAGGTATVTLEAVVQRVKYDVEQVAGVQEASPVVVSHGRSVSVRVDLRTDPQVEIPAKTEEVCQVVRNTVVNRMGVALKHLNVRLRPSTLVSSKAGGGPAPLRVAPSGQTGQGIQSTILVSPTEPNNKEK